MQELCYHNLKGGLKHLITVSMVTGTSEAPVHVLQRTIIIVHVCLHNIILVLYNILT